MPKRALVEKRPWLLVSLTFGISYWLFDHTRVPGLYEIAWKGTGVGFLAVYAWAHHPTRDAHRIALVMALGALGDMVLEIDFTLGAIAFMLGHLAAIALYVKHRRATATRSQMALGLATLLGVPLIAFLLSRSPQVALYALSLGGMAAAAWLSDFSRYRVGLGAMLFVASDLLIFAKIGQLWLSPMANAGALASALVAVAKSGGLVWPLYYFGQFLICVGVIGFLRRQGQFTAE